MTEKKQSKSTKAAKEQEPVAPVDEKKTPRKKDFPDEVSVTRDAEDNITGLGGFGWDVSLDATNGVAWHVREQNWVGESQIVTHREGLNALRDLLNLLP